MKKFYILLLFFLIPNLATAQSKTPVELVKILDGDTVIVKIKNNKFPVRLTGIDCYETSKNNRIYKQAYLNNISVEGAIEEGNKSKEYLINLSKDVKNVYFKFQGIDTYNRALGIIYFDRLNINEEMLNSGGCMLYEYKKAAK